MPARRQSSDATELARRLHSAAIRLLRRARRDDAALGLPPGQASALSVLVFGGAKTATELARIEQVRAPTMTRMVDALERRGLVRREADRTDRRRTQLSATPTGVRLMQKGRDRRVAILARALAQVDVRRRALLEGALAVIEDLPQ
jgi:DNA-binding MarR family transcriptional regulator